jgi:hypothetical protein
VLVGLPINNGRFISLEKKEMKCNICDSDIEEDNGDIVGQFGISPVSFCVWCVSSMTDMVIQLNGFDDIDMLQQRINDLKEEYYAEQKQSQR